MKKILGICLLSGSTMLGVAANAQPAPPLPASLTPSQQSQVKALIKQYLSDQQNLVQLSAALDKANNDNTQISIQNAVPEHINEIFFAPNSNVLGNPQGAVTMVEFFDYLCPYCKAEVPVIGKLIAANPNLRVILKQFPIHGAVAEFAALAALASAKQGKFLPFHLALMGSQQELNRNIILDLAKKVGLNVQQLQKDMKSESVKATFMNDINLAKAMNLPGTPMFIVANFVPATAPQTTPSLKKSVVSFGGGGQSDLQAMLDQVSQAN